MKNPACLVAAFALSACSTVPDDTADAMIWTAAEGSAVGLWEAVAAGELIVEPQRVTQDSRCPINARCVWAGEITVLTKVYGPQWLEEIEVTLGEPARLRGFVLQLTSAEPGQMAGGDPIDSRDYQFTYESWIEDGQPD